MQKSSWRARAEAAHPQSNICLASKPEDNTKPKNPAPSNEPLKADAQEGKELAGFCRRLSRSEVRRMQMKGGPLSLKVNPLAQPRWFA